MPIFTNNITSLQNFGVLGTGGVLHPKIEYKFSVTTDLDDPNKIFSKQVSLIEKPKVRLTAGQGPKYDPIKIVMRDDASNFVTQFLDEYIEKRPSFNLFHLIFDHSNTTIEKWEYTCCLITEIDYGTSSYTSSNPTVIAIKIEFATIEHIFP